MYRGVFLKDFDHSREIQKKLKIIKGESKEMYFKRAKLIKYGLDGEEKVAYELHNILLPFVCLYDLRIKDKEYSIQVDFVLISKNTVFLIEVKNLMGNILVQNNSEVIRILHKPSGVEECGMANPFTQIKKQQEKLSNLLKDWGYSFNFVTVVVMANPKTLIYNSYGRENIIKYDQLNSFLSSRIDKSINIIEESIIMEIGNKLKEKNKEYSFARFNKIGSELINNVYIPKDLTDSDYALYEELLTFRKEYSKKTDVPLYRVFTNKEAEKLALLKPCDKEAFISINGFKEKRYSLYGEEVIKIIKDYKNK